MKTGTSKSSRRLRKPSFRPNVLPFSPAFTTYTLPGPLLNAIVQSVGEKHFNAELLRQEREWSERCGAGSHTIGFRQERPIGYSLLVELESLSSFLDSWPDSELESIGLHPKSGRYKEAVKTCDKRVAGIRLARKAYAGWLICNAQFQKEQEQFVVRWGKQIEMFQLNSRDDIPPPRPSLAPLAVDLNIVPLFARARRDFLNRWRLEGMAGAFLPSPMGPQVPLLLASQAERLSKTGMLLYLPDILPLPEREELRQLIEEARDRDHAPSHLQEWTELIRNDSVGKKALAGHARRLVLHHYWRVLFSRHADALQGHLEPLRRAFGLYFFGQGKRKDQDNGAETIKKDLAYLSKARNAGTNWFRHPRAWSMW